jgi:hypothetical protein
MEILLGPGVALAMVLAFVGWLIFPILPLVIVAGSYALVRHGIPAAGRAAIRLERSASAAVRAGLDRLVIRAAEPALARRFR